MEEQQLRGVQPLWEQHKFIIMSLFFSPVDGGNFGTQFPNKKIKKRSNVFHMWFSLQTNRTASWIITESLRVAAAATPENKKPPKHT